MSFCYRLPANTWSSIPTLVQPHPSGAGDQASAAESLTSANSRPSAGTGSPAKPARGGPQQHAAALARAAREMQRLRGEVSRLQREQAATQSELRAVREVRTELEARLSEIAAAGAARRRAAFAAAAESTASQSQADAGDADDGGGDYGAAIEDDSAAFEAAVAAQVQDLVAQKAALSEENAALRRQVSSLLELLRFARTGDEDASGSGSGGALLGGGCGGGPEAGCPIYFATPAPSGDGASCGGDQWSLAASPADATLEQLINELLLEVEEGEEEGKRAEAPQQAGGGGRGSSNATSPGICGEEEKGLQGSSVSSSDAPGGALLRAASAPPVPEAAASSAGSAGACPDGDTADSAAGKWAAFSSCEGAGAQWEQASLTELGSPVPGGSSMESPGSEGACSISGARTRACMGAACQVEEAEEAAPVLREDAPQCNTRKEQQRREQQETPSSAAGHASNSGDSSGGWGGSWE
jgi:hypothetical protein